MLQVPVLFDRKTQRIVNNESADIIRIFATGFKVCGRPLASLTTEANICPW